MKLENLVGEHVLQGIEVGTRIIKNEFDYEEEVNYIKFRLDGITYLATEDPDDGYRSYMNELESVDEDCEVKLPDVRVLCRMREDDDFAYNDVLEFLDIENGKCVLAVGTENIHDYYPYCILEYYPGNMACNKEAEE